MEQIIRPCYAQGKYLRLSCLYNYREMQENASLVIQNNVLNYTTD